jgi:hypothetical protein
MPTQPCAAPRLSRLPRKAALPGIRFHRIRFPDPGRSSPAGQTPHRVTVPSRTPPRPPVRWRSGVPRAGIRRARGIRHPCELPRITRPRSESGGLRTRLIGLRFFGCSWVRKLPACWTSASLGRQSGRLRTI